MSNDDYMKRALEAVKDGFSLDMPVMVSTPDVDFDADDSSVSNLRMAVEYQGYFDDYMRLQGSVSRQAALPNTRGRVPVVEIDLGYSFGRTVYSDDSKACVVALDKKLRNYDSLFRKRVYFHEAGHVQAAKLAGHCTDLDDAERIMVLESIPEYAMRRVFELRSKKKNDEFDKLARLIKTTTPYKDSVAFGEITEKNYKGGYARFMYDLQEKGGRYAMDTLDASVRSKTGRTFKDELKRKL
ncbi:hypothetical protein CL614_04340 [archaeon]|nr:hypothetical protein [archaeon]|tara:strand:- start:3457 stop:4179 length:723 start_codon:yes stop_codon:yes gene_type:complete